MRRRVAALALAGTLALSGCATADDSSNGVTGQLQTTVAQLTSSAAAGDLPAALDALARLEQSTKDAYAAGRISAAKRDEILTAVATVRQKLEAQLTAQGGTPAPAPSGQGGSGGTSSAGRGSSPAPEDEEDEAPEEEQAPAPSTPSDNEEAAAPTEEETPEEPKPSQEAEPPTGPSATPSVAPSTTPSSAPSKGSENNQGAGQSQLQGAEPTTQSAG